MLSVLKPSPHPMERSTPVDDCMAPHHVVTAAANGCLPEWADAELERRAHMARVADLLDSWAEQLGLEDEDRVRWRATGYLHDALRDAPPTSLRRLVPDRDGVPDGLLHGPAAAERLRTDGVTDEELLAAIEFHTTGDATLGRLGRALYAADFLEPGRTFSDEWRGELRSRAPADLDEVVLEVARARVAHHRARRQAPHPASLAFLNELEAERHE